MGAQVSGEGDAVFFLQGKISDNDNIEDELVVEVTVDKYDDPIKTGEMVVNDNSILAKSESEIITLNFRFHYFSRQN